MVTSARDRIVEMLQAYEDGLVTAGERDGMIAEAALCPDFFEHLPMLSAETLASLVAYATNASGHPEDVFLVRSSAFLTVEAARSAAESERMTCFLVGRELRRYFLPDAPSPRFEPTRRVGKVDEIRMEHEVATLIGDFEAWLVRDNPLFLVSGDGASHRLDDGASIVEVDPASDLIHGYCSRLMLGLRLSNVDSSWARARDHLELWVDRTAKAGLLEAEWVVREA